MKERRKEKVYGGGGKVVLGMEDKSSYTSLSSPHTSESQSQYQLTFSVHKGEMGNSAVTRK